MLPDGADPGLTPTPRKNPWAWLWLLGGFAALLLGFVGVVTPLLPTVPLVLLAAFCFSKGSARWEAWLLAHPRFGPWVANWRAHRAVPRRAKWLASMMMSLSCAFAIWRAPWWAALLACLVCLSVALWLWRLPDVAH